MEANAVTLAYTTGVEAKVRQTIARTLEAAGLAVQRSFVHAVPSDSSLRLAPPSVEVRVRRALLAGFLTPLAEALSDVRRRAPDVGLLLVVESAGARSWYAWRREATDESVKAGVLTLRETTEAAGAFGWDPPQAKWMRL
jgi:hypothetical protein